MRGRIAIERDGVMRERTKASLEKHRMCSKSSNNKT